MTSFIEVAYSAGYAAALVPPPDQPINPYVENTPEYENWSNGYSDATDDFIRSNGGEYEDEQ